MDKNAAIDIVRRFRKAIEARNIVVNKIVLFGSYAFGNQREGSDIDVAVISDDFRNKGYWDRIDILSHAIYEVFEPIEAIALTTDVCRIWQKKEDRLI